VVYAHDEDGASLLCLLIKETESLVLLRVSEESGGVSVGGVLPAVAVVAVQGSRKR
jgi:hypothetical protein